MNKLHMLNKKLIVFTVIGVAVSAVIIAGFYYYKPQIPSDQEEAKDLVSKVSRFIVLPEGELPAIATVSDYEKLKDQPFFENSQNGDKVLIYTESKKAYLYRPTTDRLIDVTIVSVDQTLAPSSDPKLEEIKIVLRNGTSVVGLTHKIEPEVKKILPNATITIRENAKKSDYESTTVVVLNDKASYAASLAADYLETAIGNLPEGEDKPENADILIVIGKDKTL